METNTIELTPYLEKGIDFKAYYQDVEKVIAEEDITKMNFQYYAMNYQRMQRLQNKIILSEQQRERLTSLSNKIDLLIITEGWCGDAAQIIPVIEKMVEASEMLQGKIVYRDENPSLISAYLTNGGKSIPIVIGVEANTGEEIFRWGPRPEFGNILLKSYKAGELTQEEFQLTLQKEYNKDKGNAIIDELLLKLEL